MTDAGWAERVVAKVTEQFEDDYGPFYVTSKDAAKLLKAEHARSVRILKAEMERVKLNVYQYSPREKSCIIAELGHTITALQRGRGGKG